MKMAFRTIIMKYASKGGHYCSTRKLTILFLFLLDITMLYIITYGVIFLRSLESPSPDHLRHKSPPSTFALP